MDALSTYILIAYFVGFGFLGGTSDNTPSRYQMLRIVFVILSPISMPMILGLMIGDNMSGITNDLDNN